MAQLQKNNNYNKAIELLASNGSKVYIGYYAALIDKIEGEEMNTTAGRFKIALNNIVLEKQLFWRIVKQIRRDAN